MRCFSVKVEHTNLASDVLDSIRSYPRPKVWPIKFFTVAFLALCLGYISLAHAQFYKWQDAYGNWHISDEPPPKSGSEQPVNDVELLETPSPAIGVLPSSTQSSDPATSLPADVPDPLTELDSLPSERPNLARRLTDKFPDTMPIAKATLSVVTIETALGQGAGFFVTPSGDLITHKQVVRPADSAAVKQSLADLAARKEVLKNMERDIDSEALSLRELKKEIRRQKKLLRTKSEGSTSKKMASTEIDNLQNSYDARQSDHYQSKRSYRKMNQSFKKLESDLTFKMGATGVARRFKVYLKDGSQHWARLVSIEDEFDLALLKVDATVTPFLFPSMGGFVSQGVTVFAIGGPLGTVDTVSKGIVTGITDDLIATDLPTSADNSGGPLVTEWGDVIGMNIHTASQSGEATQSGRVIPISQVFHSFASKLPPLPSAP